MVSGISAPPPIQGKVDKETPSVKPGPLVLIREQDTPWKLGLIREARPESDGKVHAVTK